MDGRFSWTKPGGSSHHFSHTPSQWDLFCSHTLMQRMQKDLAKLCDQRKSILSVQWAGCPRRKPKGNFSTAVDTGMWRNVFHTWCSVSHIIRKIYMQRRLGTWKLGWIINLQPRRVSREKTDLKGCIQYRKFSWYSPQVTLVKHIWNECRIPLAQLQTESSVRFSRYPEVRVNYPLIRENFTVCLLQGESLSLWPLACFQCTDNRFPLSCLP